MRACLIPPRGYERSALASTMHLVLPLDSLSANQEYIDTYQAARARGDYIILDNGCAEGQLVNGYRLLNFARTVGAHEIVAPDVMDCGPCTEKETLEWLEKFPEAADYSIMGVLQGKAFDEWSSLLKAFANMEQITTIGVPKVHVRKPESEARLEMVRAIQNEYPNRFKIHLLGLNGIFPTEILALEWPNEVRSMDSSQPYKLAERNLGLSPTQAWAKRRENYFEAYRPVSAQLLERNIRTFIQWAEL